MNFFLRINLSVILIIHLILALYKKEKREIHKMQKELQR